jgi:ABC-type nitrate/sulfonate/bicarbonate transport system permease component
VPGLQFALASPLATFRYTATLVASESFDLHLLDTLRAFAIAYALSVVIGLLLGFWLGFDRLSGDTLKPMIVSVYAIPKLTLIGSLLAEMFASQRGLGYLLMNGIGLHNVELIMSVTLIIVAFAAAVSSLLLHVDHRLHRRA